MTRPSLAALTAPAGGQPVSPANLAVDGDPAAETVAGELVAQVADELPGLAERGQRERLLLAAWLASLRSPRTRRAYCRDVAGWLDWLAARGVGVLAARRVHVDLWLQQQAQAGAAPASMRRRLSALSSFYRHAASHDLLEREPTAGVARPAVDPDYTATAGLDRDQARALLQAADADTGPQALRSAAVVRLLLHNGLRVDEAITAELADLGADAGHRVLRITRKGHRRAAVPLTPATTVALDAYLQQRAQTAGRPVAQLAGPVLATSSGGRLRQSHLWDLTRRLARAAGIAHWDQLSPHSLRHSAITLALDAGASMRDVQDYAGHRDPRTTRRYDHTRGSLDRNPAYTLAGYLA